MHVAPISSVCIGTEWQAGIQARKRWTLPVGAWFSQCGPLNAVHHVWWHEGLEARRVRREAMWREDGWSNTVTRTGRSLVRFGALTEAYVCLCVCRALVPLIQTMKATIMTPMPYSPLT